MKGLMQDYPLTINHIFERAEKFFGASKIVTAAATGTKDKISYADWADRTRRLGGVMDLLGVSGDGRVGTFAWNTARHMELYFAVPCTDRVLHTLNIRLVPEQLVYTVNHAEDEVIFIDRSLIGPLWPLADKFPTVKRFVVMDDGAGDIPDDDRILDYEDLLQQATPAEFNVTDEYQAAAMCYTSGTTGNPKGVVYSHRSTFLHSLGNCAAQAVGFTESDTILPVVPMFHANAWGSPYAGALAGSNFVMPGPNLAPDKLTDLLESEKVTVTLGVPTIWMGVLGQLDGRDLSSLRMITCGGSAVPRSLSEAFREKIGLPIIQGWGMTETSPVASLANIKSTLAGLPEEEKADFRAKQGIPLPGVDVRIVDPDTDDELPWDGKAFGDLHVRGPWIASEYYNYDGDDQSFTDDGWLRTGDVANIDPEGYIQLVDRTKDVIKSGGEWISSVELENLIMGHPAVAEAAVIGVRHPKWQERPLACVVLKEGETATKEEIVKFLEDKIAKWQLPDDVVFIDEVPKTSVGKFSKKDLRERFQDYELPTV